MKLGTYDEMYYDSVAKAEPLLEIRFRLRALKWLNKYKYLSIGIFLFCSPAFSRAQETPAPADGAALVEKENKVVVKHGPADWTPAAEVPEALAIGDSVHTGELSRAAVRLTDRSMLRLDELTSMQVVPPAKEANKEGLDLTAGAVYFFSREKPREMEVRTPAATGALRGTEFLLRVANGVTQLTMFDGEVELSNAAGSIVLHSGEQGEAAPGQAPHKTAMIAAINIIQWCLYYPAIIDPQELGMSEAKRNEMSDSLAAYNAGDLLAALQKLPASGPETDSSRIYRAAVLLAVGRVDQAQKTMEGASNYGAQRNAIQQMIAAVKLQDWTRKGEPQTASEWMAQSYYDQSRGDLENARLDAQHATEKAPNFGFAWARLAELQFSFGRTPEALDSLDRGMTLTPRNAEGLALRGFLYSADNDMERARESFNEAILVDGALGNAWLGRGLTYIRQGKDELGRRDLQTAATLEPNRSILRSYLGKAFSQIGDAGLANKDFKRAKELDPNDPTPWLYSAIEAKQENRYNQAVDDLETSVDLNDNRRIFRSKFLLDQDKSIRGTNLAAIFQNDGMIDQSVREAVLAVDDSYTSAAAHLFLANSYDALRDPTRILLRYETPWFNELLLSNLLSPVGAGPLSQFVTQEEYSKMFAHDGFGGSSVFNYLSSGQYEETASQYGTFGNFSYALDTQLFYDSGLRPNDVTSRQETYAQFKYQLAPQDTIFFQSKIESAHNGDVFQYYDQNSANTVSNQTTQFKEDQYPGLLLMGYHHNWSPGNDTLLLAGRLEDQQVQTAQDTDQAVITRNVSAFTNGLPAPAGAFANPFAFPQVYQTLSQLTGQGQVTAVNDIPLNYTDDANFETYTGEFQQILTPVEPDTIIFGGRFQHGEFDTGTTLLNTDTALGPIYSNELGAQDYTVSLNRINLYLYNTWHIAPWLSTTEGVTYDQLFFPENYRTPPINNDQQKVEKVSPKVGFILTPATGTVLRAAYMQAISGASFDESVRLEPTEVDGFTQAYRTLASESLIGSVAGSLYDIWGVSLEQKVGKRTFLGVSYNDLTQKVDRTIGAFDFLNSAGAYPNEILPSGIEADDKYHEQVVTATVNELIGDNWSLGAKYVYTISYLQQEVPELEAAVPNASSPLAAQELAANGNAQSRSTLQQVDLQAIYNHPCGFFALGEAKWFSQNNDTFAAPDMPGDDFWQFNLTAGYRFYRNQCELSAGVLDINDANYMLDPLNPYEELPRSRTFVFNARLSF